MKPLQNDDQSVKFAEKAQICLTKQQKGATIELHSNAKEELAMLLEFSCSDHKSIKDQILFSTVASKDTTNEDSLYTYGSTRVLRTAVIYGANGSGKSNFVDAMQFGTLLLTVSTISLVRVFYKNLTNCLAQMPKVNMLFNSLPMVFATLSALRSSIF